MKYTIVVEHVALAFPTLPLNLNRGQKQFGLKNWKCKIAYTAEAAHNVLPSNQPTYCCTTLEAVQSSQLKLKIENEK